MENTPLPPAFAARMRQSLGSEFSDFEKCLAGPSPTSIRVNPRKPIPLPFLQKVPWCDTGFYLPSRPVFTLDPHLHAGAYYVQEASSMFLEQAIRQLTSGTSPLRVLDLCAAPGGKSTHLLSLLSPESLLVANEVIRSRATVLSENIQKWGYPNVMVTNNDPEDFQRLPEFFDVILVDAPCSGEGLFRKEPEAMKEWSEENGSLCSLRQRRIVADVWPALKEGGLLIYSTCTYNEEENEKNLVWVSNHFDTESLSLSPPAGAQSVTVGGIHGYHFLPHRLEGEGFFLSCLRKASGHPARSFTKQRREKQNASIQEARQWLTGDFHFIQHNDLLIAWPEVLSSSLEEAAAALNVLTKGVAVASVKHNKLVPEHALSLSTHLHPGAFVHVDVTLDQAIQYLRKETIPPFDSQRGFALIRYENNALGWINRLGNRINNLYPPSWRIRMEAPSR